MATSGIDNLAALVPLHTLTHVQNDLAVTEKRISTGKNVADANDNGAIFAIAQSIVNQNAGVTAVNSQLNGAQGLLSVSNAALGQVSDLMTQVASVLTQLSDQSISSDSRAQLATQYNSLVSTIGNDLGTAPIFNWLLYGYGVPAISFWVAGWLLRQRGDGERRCQNERQNQPHLSMDVHRPSRTLPRNQ